MPGTCRTLAQLYSLFADNLIKAITAQAGRDLCASALGYTGSRAPTANDDNANSGGTGQYFDVGSTWIDFAHARIYFCVDGSAGAAVWVQACCTTFPAGIAIPLADPHDIGVLMEGAAGQLVPYIEVRDNSGNPRLTVAQTGGLSVIPQGDIAYFSELFDITQTADFLQFKDSLGALLVNATYNGELGFKGLLYSTRLVTGNYTATAQDSIIHCDTTTAALTVTLPPLSAVTDGRYYYVKRISGTAHTATVKGNGTEQIDTSNSRALTSQFQGVGVVADHGNTQWRIMQNTQPFGSGGGSVTSVALALPTGVFTVTGSPITASGTLTGSFANQGANTVLAGPSSGASAVPTFRALVPADLAGISPILPLAEIVTSPLVSSGSQITVDWTGAVSSNAAVLTTSGTHLSIVQAGTYLVGLNLFTTSTSIGGAFGGWLTPGGGVYWCGDVRSVPIWGATPPSALSAGPRPVSVSAGQIFDLSVYQTINASINIACYVYLVKIG